MDLEPKGGGGRGGGGGGGGGCGNERQMLFARILFLPMLAIGMQ